MNEDNRETSGLTAVFGDVHGNAEALEAVLRDAREQGAAAFACLGDVVGYGASPNACCDLVRALGCPVVRGNHDHAAARRFPLGWFSQDAARAVQWTRLALSDENRSWLHDLPFEASISGAQLVHASLDDPSAWHYMTSGEAESAHFAKQTARICFMGHTHVPLAFVQTRDRILPVDLAPVRISETDDVRIVVNPGAVGQPRDGNPNAAYVLYDPATRTIVPRRVRYDVRTAAAKIVHSGLPRPLAQRLRKGE